MQEWDVLTPSVQQEIRAFVRRWGPDEGHELFVDELMDLLRQVGSSVLDKAEDDLRAILERLGRGGM